MLTAAVIWPLGYAAFSTLQGNQRQLTCSSVNLDPNSPGPCMVNDRVALSFFLGVLFAASFILSRSTSNHQYIWDLVVRVWRKCRLCVTKKEHSLSKTDAILTLFTGDYCLTCWQETSSSSWSLGSTSPPSSAFQRSQFL